MVRKMIDKRPLLYIIATFVIFGVTTYFIVSGGSSPSSQWQAQNMSNSDGVGFTPPAIIFGTPVSLSAASAQATFPVKIPNVLPSGTAISHAYISGDSDTVYLFYSNSGMKELNLPFPAQIEISESLSATDPIPLQTGGPVHPMIISGQQGDGPVTTFTSISQSSHATPYAVCGVIGVGSEIVGNDPATLVWWKGGVLYTVSGMNAVSTLQSIATSMC